MTSAAEIREMMERFNAESDRAAVVLAAASLDSGLLRLLRAFLRPFTGGGDDPLLDGDAPLGTFSARITAAHRLGLIDDRFVSALHLLRKIRNGFAHEVGNHTLTDQPHCNRVRELLKLYRSSPWLEVGREYLKAGDGEGPGADFRLCAAMLLMRVEAAIKHVVPVALDREVRLVPSHLPGESKKD